MNTRQAQNYNLWISIGVAVIALLLILFWWTGDLGRWLGGTPSTAVDQPATSQPATADTATPAPETAEQQPSEEAAPASEGGEAPASGN